MPSFSASGRHASSPPWGTAPNLSVPAVLTQDLDPPKSLVPDSLLRVSLLRQISLPIHWKLFWKELKGKLKVDSGAQASSLQSWGVSAKEPELTNSLLCLSFGCKKDSLLLTYHLQEELRLDNTDT